SRLAEERERRRIARDLHDEAGQSMAFLRLQLEMIERELPANLRPRVAAAGELAARTMVELRRIVAALSPSVLDRLGLEPAMRQLAVRFRSVHHAELRLRLAGCAELPRALQEVIYRAAQESLQNIARHSKASRVNLSLVPVDKRIRLRITD